MPPDLTDISKQGNRNSRLMKVFQGASGMTIHTHNHMSTDTVLNDAAKALLRRSSLCQFRSGVLVRLSIPVQSVDILSWLGSLDIENRSYFSHRDQTLVVAGLGIAVERSALSPADIDGVFSSAQDIVRGTDALWIGGCSFSGRSGTRQWQGFPGARFVLPLVELREFRGEFSLSVNLFAHSFGEWQTQLLSLNSLVQQLHYHPLHLPEFTHVVKRRNSVSQELWRSQVAEALAKIESGELEKVVLAREVLLELSEPANPLEALELLQEINPGCYGFAIETGGKWFFGCSPERLFSRSGDKVFTEALAGTVRRGRSLKEDLQLENRLLVDPKLILEHQLVTKAITDCLRPLANSVEPEQGLQLVKLGRIQHRCQPLTASVPTDIGNGQLYTHLHPTPAICGYPRNQAQAFIREIEQLGRGWYSGAVGIIGTSSCELSVAIRSALCEHQRLWLYSGVGIVKGSNADSEWQELESKLESMLSVLGQGSIVHCDV